MNFSELSDNYHAFDDFITVEQAKYTGLIPEDYVGEPDSDEDIFPNRCKCGSENIINYGLTRAMCCDPRCKYKLGLALAELFARFSIKGIGEATCTQMVSGVYDKLKFKSHLEILNLSYNDYPSFMWGTVKASEFFNACQQIKKRSLTFAGLIGMIGIPQFNTGTAKLFSGVNSSKELINLMKNEGGISNYCANRGVYDSMKVFWLYNSIVDIMLAEQIFRASLRTEGYLKIKICITGSLSIDGKRVTRNDFVDICNETGRVDGIQYIEVFNTSAKESCNYVVADYESSSAKYLAGKQRGILINSSDFLLKIKENVECLKIGQMTSF